MKRFHLLTAATCALLCSGSPTFAEDPKEDKLEVTVAILPHAFLVKSIGGDKVNINTLVGKGMDPHQFAITPAQTIALSGADVYFSSDMPFEDQFMDKITAGAKGLKIVKINRGITFLDGQCFHEDHDHGHEEEGEVVEPAVDPEAVEDEHDHDHEHHDHGIDPHTWTSPALLMIQADTIQKALAEAAPEHAKEFSDNLDTLFAEILEVDDEIAARLKPHKGKAFFVFHPAFGYFANQYGLVEWPIEVSGKKPTPKQLLTTIKEAGAAKAKTLFIEPQFDTSVTKEVARQIGSTVTMVDPLSEDLLNSLKEFAKDLEKSFAE